MMIVDSNVWIALFNTNDSQHAKATRLMESISEPVGIPEYVVTEVCSVLVARHTKESADAFVDMLGQTALVTALPSAPQFFAVILAYFRQHPHHGLSFIDVSLLWLSRMNTVLTFDDQLNKAINKGRKGLA